ncbi:MAG: DUF4157 domain-containing protein [Chloroflexi bacterium]|nr:DUF4157 domain-containing protein [Chloroflexota bacterium]
MKAGPGLLQRQGMEEEALQMKAGRGSLQLQGMEEEELQMKASPGVLQRQGMEEEIQGKFEPVQKKENKTGMPDDLKSGVENLSGMSMDDVKVHYNSAKPAALQALAYTQGTDIHVGPGQEKHLPHEAWHVAQQKQGRVKPTMQIGGTRVNDDAKLEKEADVLGSLASANREWIDPHGISSSVHTITVQRSTAGNLRQAENNWSSVREIHDRATYETLPKYDDSVRERDGEIASAGLSSWTKTHLTTTSASFAELNQAADYESVHGVRGTLARTVRSMPDVTVESAKVKMAEEEKTSQSERQTDIDALIKDGHRQLGLSRSSAVTGVNTWRIVMKIQNRENPWPFTPTSIPIEDPFPYELGEAAKKRSLRHDKGLGIMRTQVEVYSARFGHFQFAI